MKRKHLFWSCVIACLILTSISFVSCGGSDSPVETPPQPPVSSGNGTDNGQGSEEDFNIGGKWKIISIDGVTWETLSFAESSGYVVFEKDGTYTTRQGGYHLLNISGTSRFVVEGKTIKVYNNGNVAGTFKVEAFSGKKLTTKLTQGGVTRTVVMELQPIVLINTYEVEFYIPSYSSLSSYFGNSPKWVLSVPDKTLCEMYINNARTKVTFTTSKKGKLQGGNSHPNGDSYGYTMSTFVDLEPGEYTSSIGYWKWKDGSGYVVYTTSCKITITLLNSVESYDDEDEEQEQNPRDYTSYSVQVLLTASGSSIEGCTFRYYLGSKEAVVGQPDTWKITEATTLKISTYVGTRLIGSKSTSIKAEHNFSTEVQYYDKDKKVQTGYVFVTGNY